MQDKSSAPSATHRDETAERIKRDAVAHPERTYSEHVAAAEEIAAVEYREEIRAMMRAGSLDGPADEL